MQLRSLRVVLLAVSGTLIVSNIIKLLSVSERNMHVQLAWLRGGVGLICSHGA